MDLKVHSEVHACELAIWEIQRFVQIETSADHIEYTKVVSDLPLPIQDSVHLRVANSFYTFSFHPAKSKGSSYEGTNSFPP